MLSQGKNDQFSQPEADKHHEKQDLNQKILVVANPCFVSEKKIKGRVLMLLKEH